MDEEGRTCKSPPTTGVPASTASFVNGTTSSAPSTSTAGLQYSTSMAGQKGSSEGASTSRTAQRMRSSSSGSGRMNSTGANAAGPTPVQYRAVQIVNSSQQSSSTGNSISRSGSGTFTAPLPVSHKMPSSKSHHSDKNASGSLQQHSHIQSQQHFPTQIHQIQAGKHIQMIHVNNTPYQIINNQGSKQQSSQHMTLQPFVHPQQQFVTNSNGQRLIIAQAQDGVQTVQAMQGHTIQTIHHTVSSTNTAFQMNKSNSKNTVVIGPIQREDTTFLSNGNTSSSSSSSSPVKARPPPSPLARTNDSVHHKSRAPPQRSRHQKLSLSDSGNHSMQPIRIPAISADSGSTVFRFDPTTKKMISVGKGNQFFGSPQKMELVKPESPRMSNIPPPNTNNQSILISPMSQTLSNHTASPDFPSSPNKQPSKATSVDSELPATIKSLSAADAVLRPPGAPSFTSKNLNSVFEKLPDDPELRYRQLKNVYQCVIFENEVYFSQIRDLNLEIFKIHQDNLFLWNRLQEYEELSDEADSDVEINIDDVTTNNSKKRSASKPPNGPARKKPTPAPRPKIALTAVVTTTTVVVTTTSPLTMSTVTTATLTSSTYKTTVSGSFKCTIGGDESDGTKSEGSREPSVVTTASSTSSSTDSVHLFHNALTVNKFPLSMQATPSKSPAKLDGKEKSPASVAVEKADNSNPTSDTSKPGLKRAPPRQASARGMNDDSTDIQVLGSSSSLKKPFKLRFPVVAPITKPTPEQIALLRNRRQLPAQSSVEPKKPTFVRKYESDSSSDESGSSGDERPKATARRRIPDALRPQLTAKRNLPLGEPSTRPRPSRSTVPGTASAISTRHGGGTDKVPTNKDPIPPSSTPSSSSLSATVTAAVLRSPQDNGLKSPSASRKTSEIKSNTGGTGSGGRSIPGPYSITEHPVSSGLRGTQVLPTASTTLNPKMKAKVVVMDLPPAPGTFRASTTSNKTTPSKSTAYIKSDPIKSYAATTKAAMPAKLRRSPLPTGENLLEKSIRADRSLLLPTAPKKPASRNYTLQSTLSSTSLPLGASRNTISSANVASPWPESPQVASNPMMPPTDLKTNNPRK